MTLLFYPMGAWGTLIAENAAELIFWILATVAAAWFLWACWRTIKRSGDDD